MSVICTTVFGPTVAEKVVTRMTVWDPNPDGVDVARALILASYAYESRTGRAPPEKVINTGKTIFRMPHILGIRFEYMNGKKDDMSEGEFTRTMLFSMALMGRGEPESPR
jgi:hypothetical protein